MALSSAAADRSPVLRVGLMSDTHVNCDLKSCERTRLALETFRREHVDVVAHLGDLANFHWPEAFRNYRRTLDAVYPDRNTGPRFLYAWGNHDSIDYSRRQQKDRQMDRSAAFAVMKEIIGIDHELAFETEIGGYAFLGFPETVTDVCSWKEFERRVAAACARHAGKPVFVLHHPPPRNTCDRSEKGCCATSRTIFNRHPQVVALSGHLHTTVLNERSIWQGAFTAFGTATLRDVGSSGFASGVEAGYENARTPAGKGALDALKVMGQYDRFETKQGQFVRVYADRLVVSRRDFVSDLALTDDLVMPLPAAEQKPFAFETRAASAKPPKFAPGAALAFAVTEAKRRDAKKKDAAVKCVEIVLPPADAEPSARGVRYVITATGADGRTYTDTKTFAVRKFDWQGLELGKDRVVIPPAELERLVGLMEGIG